MIAVSIAVVIGFALCIAIPFANLLERDRVRRFPTVADRLPRATLTGRQRRNLEAMRADLRAALDRGRR